MAQVEQDMAELLEESDLLLIACTMYTHEDKQKVIAILRTIRGRKDTGWTIDLKAQAIQPKASKRVKRHPHCP